MDNKGYLNFDEAVAVLNTTRSTLYKWLQAGKVPGHKLGRQWRFRKEELINFLDGDESEKKLQLELDRLSQFFEQRKNKPKEMYMKVQDVGELAEKLLWDAADAKATDVHLYPSKGQYSLSYRQAESFEHITDFDKEVFEALINYWHQISTPTTSEDKRRFFMQKEQESGKDSLQVRLQQLETVRGHRVTLKVLQTNRAHITLEAAMPTEENLKQFRSWCSRSHGIIVVAGKSGSGKTTTLYCAIQELVKQNRVVFTIESPVEFIIDDANQVEVDFSDIRRVNEAFGAIYDSDFDVLCLGLGDMSQNQELMIDLARRSASSGHLVLLQMEANSAQEALEEVSAKWQLDDYLIGISWQKLVHRPNKPGRYAEHELLSGRLEAEE